MSASRSIAPLPAGWPYAPRSAGELTEREFEATIDGLGSGWTLLLRAPVSFEAAASELPHAFGRGGVQRIGEVVVRPYRRGGLVLQVNERVYLSPLRFAREFTVHRALWAAGFPTVEPLGYGFRGRLWGVEGLFLTRYAEASAWPACWNRSGEVLPQLELMLKALVSWGLYAPDLNATNVLLTPEGSVLALDWDRAHWSQGLDLCFQYRKRLLRSLAKLEAPAEVIAALQKTLSTGAQRDPIDNDG
jgi:hypothetical protein